MMSRPCRPIYSERRDKGAQAGLRFVWAAVTDSQQESVRWHGSGTVYEERSGVSGLETAIRGALERSDRTKAEVRARIYQSARQALESGLRKQGVNDPETVAEQRHQLEATIHAIEQEERERLKAQAEVAPPVAKPVTPAAPPPVSPPPAAPTPAAPTPAAPQPMPQSRASEPKAPQASKPTEPAAEDAGVLSFGADRDHVADHPSSLDDVRAERDDRPAMDAVMGERRQAAAPASDVVDEKPSKRGSKKRAQAAAKAQAQAKAKPRRRRGLFSRIFIFVVILSSIGIAAWWVYSTGLLLTAAERQTGVPTPTPTASADDFSGNSQEPKTIDPQRGFSSAWLDIFKPSDARAVKAGPNATVEVLGASDGQAVKIASRSSDADGAAIFTVSPDILREMVGKTSTIAITVQSTGEKPVQFAVSCEFDRLGGCSRHRFTANPEQADLLFRVTLPPAVTPNAPGQFIINTDMSGNGAGINVYSIRVLPGQ